MPDTNTKPPKSFIEALKDYIALSIVVFSFTVLIILMIYAFNSHDTDAFSNAKDIIGLFLPVIGTWMGTILAFYFTKENFESASRSMQQTISRLTSEEKLKTTKVKEVMINASNIDTYKFKEGQKWDTVPVMDYIDFLENAKRNRLVIFEENGKVKFVIHKSTLNSFVYEKFKEGKSKDEIKTLTLTDMMNSASKELRDYITNTVDFIGEGSTLFEAQQKMVANKICQDVFVTSSGNSAEPIKGWITNVIVTEQAKI